jgi:hypothetical protein
VKRRERTRHLIELGGLVQKSGLVDLTSDDRAVLYGAFLDIASMLQGNRREDRITLWRKRGSRAFKSDTDAQPIRKEAHAPASSFDAMAWRLPASVVRAGWPDRPEFKKNFAVSHPFLQRADACCHATQCARDACTRIASASRPSLTSSSEYKRSTADEEYRHAGARTNLKDADRPRANRPQPGPRFTVRCVTVRFREASSDQRALLRLARVCDQSLDRGSLRVHREKSRRSGC